MMEQPQVVFWFRRDLRLNDNHGFCKALKSGYKVLPIFIFDPHILDSLSKNDARVTFIYDTLQNMRKELQEKYNSSIAIYYDTPENAINKLLNEYPIKAIFTNHDYEPYATGRDLHIAELLKQKDVGFKTFKDQVIFEKDEIIKENGDPYVVYTAYMRKWKEKFKNTFTTPFSSEGILHQLYQHNNLPNVSLLDMGFEKSTLTIRPYRVLPTMIQEYEKYRNFPAADKTTYLSPHLRFGTVSIRQMVEKAIAEENETFWNELIWREFFMQILWHYPHTVTKSFKPEYDRIHWQNNTTYFDSWKAGKTGYPLVDAGMRQLNQTGYMHNRVRMVVASFLCKHLLIDWRWGETYFAEKLLDYEMSSNIGNWQWVAGCGVDAAPYFRIFNPETQLEKFDKGHKYIARWVPEFGTRAYPQPIVTHKEARELCLNTYKIALNK